jgi:hypothetical protein
MLLSTPLPVLGKTLRWHRSWIRRRCSLDAFETELCAGPDGRASADAEARLSTDGPNEDRRDAPEPLLVFAAYFRAPFLG